MLKIMFVCTGNTCRSPMAEYFMRAKGAEGLGFTVMSRGLSAYNGGMANEEAIRAMDGFGIDIRGFRSGAFDPEEAKDADIILTMTKSQAGAVKAMCPGCEGRVHTVYGYAAGSSADVYDPFGGDMLMYKQTARELKSLTDELWRKING